MKRTLRLLALAATVALFAGPALAQSGDCTDDNKNAWYDTFLKNYKGEPPAQKVAYDAAKKYLNCSPEETDISKYLKTFVTKYEAATSEFTNAKQFDDAFKNKNYSETERLGKLILASKPDNTPVYIVLGIVGLSDASFLAESTTYAKKAIELIEGGKPFAPYESKDKALAALNYAIASANLKSAPADAIPYFLKAARYDSELKKDPRLYVNLAQAYNDGPRAKLTDEYTAKKFTVETDESKLMIANLNQVIDRQIDALARAAALATDATMKKSVMDILTETYKDRNKSDAGLNDLVATVLNKPLPDMPTPLTSLPTPAATPTPTGSQPSGNNPTGAKPASNPGTPGTQGTKPSTTPVTRPTPTPTPTKPKPRANQFHG
jgi:hypothetical protein